MFLWPMKMQLKEETQPEKGGIKASFKISSIIVIDRLITWDIGNVVGKFSWRNFKKVTENNTKKS